MAQATLDLIESAADRVAILKGLLQHPGGEGAGVDAAGDRVVDGSVSMRRTFRSG